MHPELLNLLNGAPPMCGAAITVDRQILERGDEAFVHFVRSKLGATLADFIVGHIILDGGADETGFRMEQDFGSDATRVYSTVHVLTPKQLRDLMQKAFQVGQASSMNRFEYYPAKSKFIP